MGGTRPRRLEQDVPALPRAPRSPHPWRVWKSSNSGELELKITLVARTRLKGENSIRSETVRGARRRGAPGPILANSLTGRSRHSSPSDPLPSGEGGANDTIQLNV